MAETDTGTERHNDRQRRYFQGRRLPRMDPRTRAGTPYTSRHLDAMVEGCAITGDDRVVDVGCGPGKYTIGLARAGLSVEGMDLTPGLLDDLRRVEPGVATHVGDLGDPPAEMRGRFDVVTGFFMLHHVGDLAAAFAGARALLTPGGRAGFLEPNPLYPGYYVQITLTPGMSWKGDGGIVRMRPGLLRKAAEEAGFADFRTERFGAFPPFLANRPAGARVERAVEAVPGWRRARAFQLFTMRAV